MVLKRLPILFLDQKVVLLEQDNTQAAQRPNLIAIVTDDQSRWSLGVYGNREAITPNMPSAEAKPFMLVPTP